MMNALVCGTFHHEEEDGPITCPSSPKKTSKRKDHSSKDKNPYSNRGLDKFSALLADLDAKRQKLYSQMNPQDISFVRFAYSNKNDFVPIVVKVKNKDNHKKHKSEELTIPEPMGKSATSNSTQNVAVEERKQPKLESDHKKSFKNWDLKWNMLNRPSFYLPVVVILILVLLTMFGRSISTLCICVMWYVVPTLNEISDSSRKSKTKKKKKKDYGKGSNHVSVEGLASPRSGDSGASKDHKTTSGKHTHRKSWS